MKRLFIFLLLVGVAAVGWFTFRHLPQPSPIDSVDHVPQEAGITTELSRVNEPQKPLMNPSPATNACFTLKERLSKVDLNKTRYPGMAVAEMLQPQDEDELVNLFHEEALIRNRVAYMVMMTRHGGDKSAQAIIDMVKSQKGFFKDPPNDDDHEALHRAVFLLGPIAVRSNIAREFLKEACDIEYWKLHRQYSVDERGEPHEDRHLATDALTGLALSGLPEAVEVINAMKQWDRDRVDPWAGHLSEAAELFDYSKEPDHWKYLFLTDDEKMKKMMNWRESSAGKQWGAWYNKIRGIE
ncbi:MAG: hypothetical protein NTX70_00760 [Verrucomicrobia bacterium]|nr:hypothetical protein [Verrucomicrobiota bacterium]